LVEDYADSINAHDLVSVIYSNATLMSESHHIGDRTKI
jgi:hypothetical protein